MITRNEQMGLTERVTALLLASIKSKKMQPGDKLPTEQELCSEYSVSRTVIREAVARLKAEGVVSSRRGSGIFVRKKEGGSREVSFKLDAPHQLGDILDILELRMSVEIEAAGLAAERRTEAGLVELDKAMLMFARAQEKHKAAAKADLAFHSAVANATGNKQFLLFLGQLGEQVIPRQALGAQFSTKDELSVYLDRITAEHQNIYEAISNRNSEDARNAMRLHLDGSRKRYRHWSVQNQMESP